QVSVTYTFDPAEYRFGVRGHVLGLGGSGAVLVVGLGDGFRSVEADTLLDYREFAVVTKATKTQKTTFNSLKPGERATLDGPFEWVAISPSTFSRRPWRFRRTSRSSAAWSWWGAIARRRSRAARRCGRRCRCRPAGSSATTCTWGRSSTTGWRRWGTGSTTRTRTGGRSSGRSSTRCRCGSWRFSPGCTIRWDSPTGGY